MVCPLALNQCNNRVNSSLREITEYLAFYVGDFVGRSKDVSTPTNSII